MDGHSGIALELKKYKFTVDSLRSDGAKTNPHSARDKPGGSRGEST
jgi:hypothetical protein